MSSNNTRGNLVAICGLKGSGKSTLAERLALSLPAARVRFAGPLKDMLYTFGLTHEEIEGSLKEEPSAKLCGKTPRHAMLTLGTEWGRDLIGPDVWVRAWRRKAADLINSGCNVLAEDLRFPNEYEAVRLAGGVVIRVERPGVAQAAHESEAHALSFEADIVFTNDHTLDDLRLRADTVIRQRVLELWGAA